MAHINMGVALLQSRRDAEAKAELEAAIQLDPAHPEAHYYLGFLAERGNDPGRAIDAYEKFLKYVGSGDRRSRAIRVRLAEIRNMRPCVGNGTRNFA
jgi:cytochrome c-type biogenesis protein CcmH/NrfG